MFFIPFFFFFFYLTTFAVRIFAYINNGLITNVNFCNRQNSTNEDTVKNSANGDGFSILILVLLFFDDIHILLK